VTSIEPSPRLVVCTVQFVPSLPSGYVESLSGELRREYPFVSAPRVPSGPEVFYSAPDRWWAAWLTPSAIGLETRRFRDIRELQDRLGAVVRLLDAGLYQRVGLKSFFRVQPSWTPRPLPPNRRHLGQMIQWGSQGGRTYCALDVFAENVAPASLHEHLSEIFQASRYLAPDTAASEEEDPELAPDGTFAVVPAIVATAVAAYPELDPFDDPPPADPSEVEQVAGARAELLARKHGGPGLSRDEQERLRVLTARLEELLPPVSSGDLEVLVEMAEGAERIRQRDRERRIRLGLS